MRAEARPLANGDKAKLLPEFSRDDANSWINSKPLTVEALRGQVLLLDVWTFGCSNCYRSLPWVNHVERRFDQDGLRVVGVHAPEFDSEKPRERVEQKVKEFKVHHPVMIDNDHSYWRALGNRYWPSFYLIDKRSRVRASYVGETHIGDARALDIEASLQRLLTERV